MSSTATSVSPGPAGEPARGAHPAEPRGVSGVGAKRLAVEAQGATVCPEKKLADGVRSAHSLRSLPSTEWPVKGTTSTSGVRDRGRHLARVGGRRAQVLGARQDQRGHVRQRAFGGRRGRGVGPRRSRLPARLERVGGGGVEGVEVAAGLGLAGRRGLRPAGWPRRRCATTGTGVSSQVVVANSASSTSSVLSTWPVRSAASGSGPRRGRAGAAAGRGRRSAPSARPPAAAPAGRG